MSLDTEMAEQLVKLNEDLKALQKEKELDNIFWKQECDSLQKTLEEKDKEIAKLKNFMSKWHFENFESFENHYNYLMSLKNREQLMVENEAMKETIANLLGQKKTSSKAIRKQVCDEIRQYCKEHFEPVKDELGYIASLDRDDFYNFLDKIEKGENDE